MKLQFRVIRERSLFDDQLFEASAVRHAQLHHLVRVYERKAERVLPNEHLLELRAVHDGERHRVSATIPAQNQHSQARLSVEYHHRVVSIVVRVGRLDKRLQVAQLRDGELDGPIACDLGSGEEEIGQFSALYDSLDGQKTTF